LQSDVGTWAARLRRLAIGSLADLVGHDGALRAGAEVGGFSDERGARRSIDAAVLGRVFGTPAGRMPEKATADHRWWWSLATDGAAPEPEAAGAITPRRDDQAIELWTEIELGALHAATSLALGRGDVALLERCLDACAWHVAEIEPDNATGHAWAVHGFVLLAFGRGLAEAELHAQALLHGCMRGSGKPDRFSALLLLDAAGSLDAWMACRAAGEPRDPSSPTDASRP